VSDEFAICGAVRRVRNSHLDHAKVPLLNRGGEIVSSVKCGFVRRGAAAADQRDDGGKPWNAEHVHGKVAQSRTRRVPCRAFDPTARFETHRSRSFHTSSNLNV
jgi:hypothetical protein